MLQDFSERHSLPGNNTQQNRGSSSSRGSFMEKSSITLCFNKASKHWLIFLWVPIWQYGIVSLFKDSVFHTRINQMEFSVNNTPAGHWAFETGHFHLEA